MSAEQQVELLQGELAAVYEMVTGLVAERDATKARVRALEAAGERLTQYLGHTDQNCAPMYGCFCGCLEALDAWRSLAAPDRRAGEVN